jgi:hypothetical protein
MPVVVRADSGAGYCIDIDFTRKKRAGAVWDKDRKLVERAFIQAVSFLKFNFDRIIADHGNMTYPDRIGPEYCNWFYVAFASIRSPTVSFTIR